MVNSRGPRPPRPTAASPGAIGANPGRNRAHNRRVVLETIRQHGQLGRSEIARHARLTQQAVSNIVGELLHEGMLVELGRLRVGRGQPPLQFGLNPDGPLTAGVEIGADRMVAVLVDLSGRLRARQIVPLADPTPRGVPAALARLLAQVCAEAGIPGDPAASDGQGRAIQDRMAQAGTIRHDIAQEGAVPAGGRGAGAGGSAGPAEDPAAGRAVTGAAGRAQPPGGGRILGLGVVMPGPFEVELMSSVGPTTLPGWAGIDAAALLSAATGLAVTFGNDATAAAVGERLYGAGRQIGSFCHLYFGVGLGLGILHDGRPLRGAFGNSGEIGHVALVPRHRPAGTGRPMPDAGGGGAVLPLERVASLHALRESLAEAGIHAPGPADLERLHRAGCPHLAGWICRAADHLAPVVAMLENIFDPETVIFGGGLPAPVMGRLIAALEPLPVSVASRPRRSRPRVICGETGQLTAALGAAALPLLDTVSPHLGLAGPGD